MTKEKKEDMDTLIKLKNVLLAREQGKALERASRGGNSEKEAIGLGHFGPPTVIGISFLKSYELAVNFFAEIEDTPLSDLADNVARASGSRSAKRLDGTFETVGQLGQYIPFMEREFPQPRRLAAEQPG